MGQSVLAAISPLLLCWPYLEPGKPLAARRRRLVGGRGKKPNDKGLGIVGGLIPASDLSPPPDFPWPGLCVSDTDRSAQKRTKGKKNLTYEHHRFLQPCHFFNLLLSRLVLKSFVVLLLCFCRPFDPASLEHNDHCSILTHTCRRSCTLVPRSIRAFFWLLLLLLVLEQSTTRGFSQTRGYQSHRPHCCSRLDSNRNRHLTCSAAAPGGFSLA